MLQDFMNYLQFVISVDFHIHISYVKLALARCECRYMINNLGYVVKASEGGMSVCYAKSYL